MSVGVIAGLVSVFLGLIGLALTVFFNMSKFSKTMDKLLEIQHGVLTVDQAKKITSFHLREVKAALEYSLASFANESLTYAAAANDLDVVKRDLYNLAETCIVPARNSISIFLLRGDVRMDFFMETVNPINDGIIKNVVDEIIADIEVEFTNGNIDFELTLSKISFKVDETVRQANSRINSKLDELYRK